MGVWDTTANVKFSIDYLANSYLGGFFPTTSNGIAGFQWNNQASIVITNPIIENNWVNSRLIASASGVAYSDFVSWLQENENQYPYYQPSTVSFATEQEYTNNSNNVPLGSCH